MHDAVLVRRGEPGEDRLHDVHGLRCSEDPVLLQQVAEGDAGQVLHHEVRRLAVLSLVVDIDDIGMREPCGGAGLLDETCLVLVVVGQMAMHDLDGHATFESQICGEVHSSHAAARDA